jgi:hypothetical protein
MKKIEEISGEFTQMDRIGVLSVAHREFTARDDSFCLSSFTFGFVCVCFIFRDQ